MRLMRSEAICDILHFFMGRLANLSCGMSHSPQDFNLMLIVLHMLQALHSDSLHHVPVQGSNHLSRSALCCRQLSLDLTQAQGLIMITLYPPAPMT